jgi:hypothetical protein
MRFAGFAAALVLIIAAPLKATPTENNSFRILPAPGKVVVDGKPDDWDLSGGIFICDDVQTQRDNTAAWVHAMYDRENLYLLARFKDLTPLNNPGQTIADYGFQGDSLQLRIITHPGQPVERGNHFTAWQGRDGRDIITMEGGKTLNEPKVLDVKALGARQAFSKDSDGKGYVQEIALPWKLLTRNGQPLAAGDALNMTFELNFTIGVNGRFSIKDLFKPNMTIDRVFTFQNWPEWGPATLASAGHAAPQPVRLADGREFPVRMERGVPTIDWTGVIKVVEQPGFKPIAFEMPEDGYVSLNIHNAEGQVVCQLLTATFFTKGRHEVKWDGLPTPNLHLSGPPLSAGSYTWTAIYHTGIGLKLRGWAHNSGARPWDEGPASNWGGDFGNPITAAANASGVYLGWGLAEAGKALIAVDLDGHVRWNNKRGGIGGVKAIAADAKTVYVIDSAGEGASLYKLSCDQGSYQSWGHRKDADLPVKSLWEDAGQKAEKGLEKADAIAATGGKIFLAFTAAGKVAVLNGGTGKLEKVIAVAAPISLWARSDDQLYVLTGDTKVEIVNPHDGKSRTALAALTAATRIAGDADGTLYVGIGAPDHQVRIYDASGKLLRSIGRRGGRVERGAWDQDTLLNVAGLAVDSAGKLWVAENSDVPKRVSSWNTKDGTLVNEFFGPPTYGALGGAINPRDPNLMVGNGCEWRLDPKTGQAACVGVITREGMVGSRFATGANGRLYLFVTPAWLFEQPKYINIFERIGDANYKLRGRFMYSGSGDKGSTRYWADRNGDEQQQPDEITTVPKILNFNAWYIKVAPDLSFYIGRSQWKVTGYTAAGAPLYDLSKPTLLPVTDPHLAYSQDTDEGLGSADGRLVLYNGNYNVERSTFRAFDIASGKMLWSYPNNFVGVHGSHNATGPETGMIRGAFGIAGVAKLPAPLGNVWAIPTNVGEWHLLTEDGYYLTHLFQTDPLKVRWPAEAVPGADMTDVPPGLGGEDFGGSMTLGTDGKLYIQAGKTAFWNLEVTGLETVRALPSGTVTLDAADLPRALAIRETELQIAVGKKQLTIARATPTFTGALDADFKGATVAEYQKGDDAHGHSAAAWDEKKLYLAWDIADASPWMNGAKEPEEMYVSGDTVDFQLGTNPSADRNRTEAAMGDLRLSIGNFGGTPTAMLYRRVARQRQPKMFNSGVFKNYEMQYVGQVTGAKIKVAKRDKGYTVEAAIPLSALELQPTATHKLTGDFGVTYGDPAGQRTRLRVYWSNQQTGIVDDAVAELMMNPKNWGELNFSR